ncbi:MAG: patatin-like phospholipase PlpD [Thalassobaculales bacterium]
MKGWARLLLVAAVLAAAVATAGPAAAQATAAGQRRPVIGLVLSGGGALGATHIGVLKVLEELKVPIDIVTGTSMGSIVGGLYAMGLDATQLETLTANIDWAKTFRDAPPRGALPMRRKQEDYGFLMDLKLGLKDGGLQVPAGLIQGQRLTLMLRELTVRANSTTDFDELPIRYRAVAADLETGKAVVLGKGNLATAMRASMSVPGVLPPVEVDGRLLVDGGVANNLPIDVARAMGAEVLIVVDIPTVLKSREQLRSSIDIAGQMLSVLIQQNAEIQLASLGPRDILIRPDLGTRGSADFDKILEMIGPGEVAARAAAGRLRLLAAPAATYRAEVAARMPAAQQAPVISFITLDNRTKIADRRLRASIRQQIGAPLDTRQIEEDFTRLYGSGLYEQIDYALVERDGRTGLHVTATEKAWAKDYLRLGVAMESDFDGDSTYALGFGLTLTALNAYGAELRNEVSIGDTQRLVSEFYQPLQAETGFYALPLLSYNRSDVRVVSGDGSASEFRTSRGDIGLFFGREWDSDLDTRIGLRWGAGNVDRRTGTGAGGETGSFTIAAAEARMVYDTLDNVNFPNDGSLIRMSVTTSFEEIGASDEYTRFEGGALTALTWGANTVVAGISGGTSLSGDLPTYDRLQVGGLFSLSGYTRNELSSENLLRGNLVYMRRLTERTPLFFDLPLYAGGSFEAARLDGAGSDAAFERNAFGGSLFIGADTPLGAGYLAIGHGDGGRTASYLYFGKVF